ARRRIRRSYPQGRETRRPSSAGTHQIRADDQPQDGQDARPRATAHAARPRRRGDRMKRREFITVLGGAAAAWPLAARAEQAALPVVGYLNFGSPESDASKLTGIRRGLNQTGYVEGRNFVIEYRWAGNQVDRLPALAAELVQLQVTVIVAAGVLPALA